MYLFFMLFENLCCTKKHSDMSIMTIRMHLSSPNETNNTSHCNWVFIGDAQFIQFLSNEFTGLKFFITQFWILMNLPSDIYHPVKYFRLLGIVQKVFGELV
ncbi:hypothetical protein CR513_00435, partial [Mucuna pruriens]